MYSKFINKSEQNSYLSQCFQCINSAILTHFANNRKIVKSEEQRRRFLCVLGFTVRVPWKPNRETAAQTLYSRSLNWDDHFDPYIVCVNFSSILSKNYSKVTRTSWILTELEYSLWIFYFTASMTNGNQNRSYMSIIDV